ncbi:DUF2730 family protein [Ancylobacter defluvii]|nr:DUF2730 family protein [Ancylobacter defluvii]
MAMLATTWFLASRSARRSEITELELANVKLREQLADVDRRLGAAEMTIRHLPDKDMSHRLEMAIARLEGRMETMDERLKPVAVMAARVQERMFEETR